MLPSAADVLLNPIPVFCKQVLRFPAPVLVFRSPHLNRRGTALEVPLDQAAVSSVRYRYSVARLTPFSRRAGTSGSGGGSTVSDLPAYSADGCLIRVYFETAP